MSEKNTLKTFTSELPYNQWIETGFFTIIFINEGTIEMTLNSKKNTIQKGQILINTPFHNTFLNNVSSNCSVIGIKFSIDYLKNISILAEFYNTVPYFQYHYLPVWKLNDNEQYLVQSLLEKLKNKEENKDNHTFGNQLFNVVFSEFIIELSEIGKNQDKNVFHNYNRLENITLQFYILAKKYYKEQPKLSFYADKLAVSTKYISETIKQVTGVTAKDTLVNLRMAYARTVLATSNMDVAQISDALCFDSSASFSNFFKKEEGITPKEYRKLHHT
ncbi:MAG: AraC family transcriptional regulator [Crocinitomicaceae bacterium]